jgi:hypothetical protein
MDKTGRRELIRALHQAKAGGMAYVPSGRPAKAKPARLVVDRLVIGWPQIKSDTKRAPAWMTLPDAAPIYVWTQRTYREELEKTLISIEDANKPLAAALQSFLDELGEPDV